MRDFTNFRRIWWIGMFITILLPWPGFSQSSSHSTSNSEYALLWRIEGNGLEKPSYLFGTMHVKNERAFRFSDSVMLALERCESFALEVEPDTLVSALFKEMYSKGQSDNKLYEEILDKEEYELLKKKFKDKNGFEFDQVKSKNPMVIKRMLESDIQGEDEAMKETFVDGYLLGIAKTLKKPILGLEDVQTQLDIFLNRDKKIQKQEILELIDAEHEKEANRIRTTLLEAYSVGDLDVISEIVKAYSTDSSMISRNRVMLNSMIGVMHAKSVFVAVGAGHLPFKNGLLELLRSKGYKVTKVKARFTGVAEKYTVNDVELPWYEQEDEDIGMGISMPGKPVPIEVFSGVEMHIYPDLGTGMYYAYFSIAGIGSGTATAGKEMMNQIIKSYDDKSAGMQLLKRKNINKNGRQATEVLLKDRDGNYIRMQFILRNNILYILLVGNTLEHTKRASAERFFNSFKTLRQYSVKTDNWIIYNNPEGAFSVSLPTEPKDVSKITTANDGLDYDVKILFSTNLLKMTNYMIAYNDMPSGYYVQNKKESFESMNRYFESIGRLVSEPDTVWLDGVEGREYKIWLSNKYYSVCRVYLRGNRTYKIIKQNIQEGINVLNDDDFLESFSFEPYQDPKGSPFYLPDSSCGFMAFNPPKEIITETTEDDYDSYIGEAFDYATTNPKSGGLFYFEKAVFTKYFKLDHRDSLYNNLIQYALGWTDTIVQMDTIEIDGENGREFITENRWSEKQHRYRILLLHGNLYYMKSFSSNDEMVGKSADQFYNSLMVNDNLPDVDIYSSKTRLILADLKSDDSTVVKQATGALGYYTFEKNDLELLHKAVDEPYPDPDGTALVRSALVTAICGLGDSSSFPVLRALYKQEDAPPTLRTQILEDLALYSDSIDPKPFYLELITSGLPFDTDNRGWSTFRLLTDDTTGFFVRNLSLFNEVVENGDIRRVVLNCCITAFEVGLEDSLYIEVIRDKYDMLTQYALSDLKTFIDSNKYGYYDSRIMHYLELFAKLPEDKQRIDAFTTKILEESRWEWLKVKALKARMSAGLDLPSKTVKKLFKSEDERYNMLLLYHEANRFEEIPAKYLNQKRFACLLVREYLTEDDDIPESMKLLGQFTHNDSIWYAISFTYRDGYTDKKEEYLAVCGPFSDSNELNFKDAWGFSNWTYLRSDWQKQAQEMMKHLGFTSE